MRKILLAAFVAVMALSLGSPAYASLTVFNTYTGAVGYSTDGFGSTTQTGTISASIPTGSTILAAYLYTSTFGGVATPTLNTFGGAPVVYTTALGTNPAGGSNLQAFRADVKATVIAAYTGVAVGDLYDFTVTETTLAQDGEALVVVYSKVGLPTSTVAILDGFSLSGGDSATLNLGAALAPGFTAEMIAGIGFSCGLPENCGTVQNSSITVNGLLITANAGNHDDSVEAGAANGNLITVGGFQDPFSALLPTYANDHERYDLAALGAVVAGNTSIKVDTLNPSNDDNIFLEVFKVSGEATVTTNTPEPSSIFLLGVGLLGLAGYKRRKLNS